VPSPFTPLQALISERTKPKDPTTADGWSGSSIDPGFGPVATNDLVIRPVPTTGPGPLLGQAVPAAQKQWKAPLLNRIPMWALALIGYGALSFGGLALASRRLTTPAAGER
jgi:hypothetical protein